MSAIAIRLLDRLDAKYAAADALARLVAKWGQA